MNLPKLTISKPVPPHAGYPPSYPTAKTHLFTCPYCEVGDVFGYQIANEEVESGCCDYCGSQFDLSNDDESAQA